MSETDSTPRPRQLTMAGGFVVAGSVFLVLSAFDSLTNLHSIDRRAEISDLLSTPLGEGLGLSLDQALVAMRVVLTIAALCAAAAAVLGVFVLQRHRTARVVLSVLAVPLLVTGGLTGALVAAATAMLWTGPARDWFAGRPVREATPRVPDPRETTPPETTPRTTISQTAAAPAALASTQRPSIEPGPTQGYGGPPRAFPTTVPGAVKAACILTWVFSGVVFGLYAAMLVVLAVARDRLVEVILDSPAWVQADLQRDLLVPVLWVGCLMFLAWSGSALVLAWFTWRRHNWARYLLVASAATGLIAGMFAFPFGLPHQLACALVIAFLFSGRAREWFAEDRARWTPPHPPLW